MVPALLLDLLFLVILVVFLLLGVHRGFVLTLCSLAAVLVALLGANLAADAAAPRVADALQPRLERSIRESLEEKARQSGTGETLPAQVALEVLKDKGGVYRWAADTLEDALRTGMDVTITQTASAAAASLAGELARGLVFFIAFFVVLLAWTVLSRALDLMARLPGLSGLNKLGGGALGLIKGLVIVYLAAWVLRDLTGLVTPETAESSRLFSLLARFDPLQLLF